MNLEELDYELPADRIAQTPAPKREESRLLVLERARDCLRHLHFADLPDVLGPHDILVFNDTRVIAAQFEAVRATGGRVDALFLAADQAGQWEVLLRPSRRMRQGEIITSVIDAVPMRLVESLGAGRWKIHVETPEPAARVLDRIGHAPLPPYIKRNRSEDPAQRLADRDRYQTVYARVEGSIAAPTAGLHFAEDLLSALQAKGVRSAHLTLHVGLGTFRPITAAHLDEHTMHEEWFHLPDDTAESINDAQQRGGRVVAVGTTSCRVLETCAEPDGRVAAGTGWTRLFIYPPYRFRAVDALITNFHLPRSTLLALVFAFAGRERTLRAYEQAVRLHYRFYSFGDAMLIV